MRVPEPSPRHAGAKRNLGSGAAPPGPLGVESLRAGPDARHRTAPEASVITTMSMANVSRLKHSSARVRHRRTIRRPRPVELPSSLVADGVQRGLVGVRTGCWLLA